MGPQNQPKGLGEPHMALWDPKTATQPYETPKMALWDPKRTL